MFRARAAVVLAMLALAACASTGATGELPTVLGALSSSRPAERTRGVTEEGEVEVQCTVQPSGALGDCLILSENPPGAGFREAALEAARQSRLSARTLRNARPGAAVRWRVPTRPE